MKIKKHLFALFIIGTIIAGAIGFFAVNVSKSANEFSGSGYVHTVSLENTDKKIMFDSGTTYKKKAGNKIGFSDIVGDNTVIDELNFVHYDDESLSSFVDGVIVDMEDLSQDSTMNHYALSSNLKLQKTGSTYSTSLSSNYSFNDFLWKIDENKYLIVSPSMKLAITSDDVRSVNNYIELTYIGDNLIQLQTKDNYWTTISQNCHVITEKGYDINLSDRNISYVDAEGNTYELLDFSRIILGSEDNVEIARGAATEMLDENKEVIPHFNITATPGEDGEAGEAGKGGNAGGKADTSEDGEEGSTIDPDKKVLDYPVFTIKDWNVLATSCSGTIVINDSQRMLVNDESFLSEGTYSIDYYGLYLIDQNTGKVIYDISTGEAKKGDAWKFYDHVNDDTGVSFEFEGLTPDHTYVLHASALTQAEYGQETYVRSYISKTFWTDSLGIYMESSSATVNTVNFNIIKRNYVDEKFGIYYKVFNSYAEAATADFSKPDSYNAYEWNTYSSEDQWIDEIVAGGSSPTYKYWACTYPNSEYETEQSVTLTNNTRVFVRLAYTYDRSIEDSTDKFDGITDQILEIATLKERPSVGAPILTVNRSSWGFEVVPSDISDYDGGIVSYTYEFYSASQFDTTADNADLFPVLKENQQPVKKYVRTDANGFYVPIDGVSIQSKVPYRVRIVAKFNDNEKVYNITSEFSNSAEISVSVRPSVTFAAIWEDTNEIQEGSYVKLRDYDAAYGYIVVNPGSIGSKLMINKENESLYNHPVVKFTLNGYYEAKYIVYDIDDPNIGDVQDPETGEMNDHYLKAETQPDGRIFIYLPDYLPLKDTADVADRTVCGLQPGKRYEITVYGDLSDDGEHVSEEFVSIGSCQVITPELVVTNATWTTGRDIDAMQKTNVKFSMDESEEDVYQYNRQSKNLQQVTFTVYNKEYDNDTAFKNAKKSDVVAKRTFNKDNNPEVFEALFSQDGLTLETAMFVDGEDSTAAQSLSNKLSQYPKLTVAISGAYDYTILDEFRQNQESFTDISQTDKKYIPENTNKNYYVNEIPLVNTRQTITSIVGINPITGNDWASYSGTIDEKGEVAIQLTAGYNLGSNTTTGGSITYYVFDAVDFYAGELIRGYGDVNEKGFYERFWYDKNNNNQEDDGEIYFANTVMQNWINPTDESIVLDYPSGKESTALSYRVPTALEGLALGTVTINFPSAQSVNSGTELKMPSCIFYPTTRAEKGVVGDTDDDGNYYLFYDTNQNIEKKGHQFVFAYTINCHTETENERYVYPFDSYVWDGSKATAEEKEISYSYYAENSDKLIYDELNLQAQLNTSDYVQDNRAATFGHDAYMLIPHTTFTKLPQADYPKNSPDCYAAQWDSNYPMYKGNSTELTEDLKSSTITMNAIVKDTDGAVFVSSVDGQYYGQSDVYMYHETTNGKASYRKVASENKVNVYTNVNNDFDSVVRKNIIKDIPDVINEQDYPYIYSQIDLNCYDDAADLNITEDKTNTALAVIPIQRYVDKYTTKQSSLHSSESNEYVTGSIDNNYQFRAISDGSSKELYKELFETLFFYTENRTSLVIDENDYLSTSTAKAYFSWSTIDGVQDDARIQIIGNRDLLKDIVGVRLYLEGWDKETLNSGNPQPFTYYIDKYIEKTDEVLSSYTPDVNKRTPIIDKSDSTVDEINSPYILNFKLSISDELSKTLTSTDGYSVKDFSNINNITYPGYNVGIKIKLLYRGNNYGFEQVEDELKSDKTYSLITYNRKSDLSVKYDGLYHELPNVEEVKSLYWFTNYVGGAFNLTKRNSSILNNYGSFFRLSHNDDDSLQVRSTRDWQYPDTSIVGLDGKQQIDSLTSVSQNIVIPTSVVESNFYIKVLDEETGQDVTNLDMPKTQPLIRYYNYNDSTSYLTFNYGITSQEDDVYFTLSSGVPNSSTGTANFYQVDNSIVNGSVRNISLFAADNSEYATYEEWKQGTGANQDYDKYLSTKALSSTSISFYSLKENTTYYVVCWKYGIVSDDGTNVTYGFRPLKMTDFSGEKVNNYYSGRTKKYVPKTGYFTVSYSSYDDNNKYLHVRFADPQTLTFSEDYIVFKLYDENMNFITILAITDCRNADLHFDLDGNQSSNIEAYDTILTYKVGNSSEYTYGLLPYQYIRYTTDTRVNLEYGKKYYVTASAYSYSTPGPNNRGYSFANDIYYDKLLNNGDLSTRPTQSFTVSDGADYVSRTLSKAVVRDDSPSYLEFTIPALTKRSGSLENRYLAPVLIWKHYTNVEKTEYEFYDVTNLATSIADGKTLNELGGTINGTRSNTLKIEFSKLGNVSYEYLSWNINGKNVTMAEGDAIYCYLFAEQKATFNQEINDESSYITGSILSTAGGSVSNKLGNRITQNTETIPVKVDNDILSRLNEKFDGTSRNMNEEPAYRLIEKIVPSAGYVTVAPFDQLQQAIVQLSQTSAPAAIGKVYYSAKATVYNYDGPTREVKNYTISEDPNGKEITIDPSKSVEPYMVMLDLSSIYRSINSTEELVRWEITVRFESVSGKPVSVFCDPESTTLATDATHTSITYISNVNSGVEDTNVQTMSPGLQTFFNNMFGTEEGNTR